MKKYPKTVRTIYTTFLVVVTIFFYQDIIPGGRIFNYFDTGETGYIFLGPIFNLVLIWIPASIAILIADAFVFKSDLVEWMNSYD